MSATSAPVSPLYPTHRGTPHVAAEDLWTLPRFGAPTPVREEVRAQPLRHGQHHLAAG
jgi:hypothetical protein